MPAAGLPLAVSKTCVVSRPIVLFSSLLPGAPTYQHAVRNLSKVPVDLAIKKPCSRTSLLFGLADLLLVA
jgi:hypothetical protein